MAGETLWHYSCKIWVIQNGVQLCLKQNLRSSRSNGMKKIAATRLLATFICIDQPRMAWREQNTTYDTISEMNTLVFNAC